MPNCQIKITVNISAYTVCGSLLLLHLHVLYVLCVHMCIPYLLGINTAATISHVLKLDMATIQGQPLFEGGIYYTEAASVRLLFNNYNSIKLKN